MAGGEYKSEYLANFLTRKEKGIMGAAAFFNGRLNLSNYCYLQLFFTPCEKTVVILRVKTYYFKASVPQGESSTKKTV